MHKKLLYQALFIILFPCRLLAWGYTGHQLVAELAVHQLSDATRAKVERILNGMNCSLITGNLPIMNNSR